jgi:uncharacterized protein (DUF4415 family)
MKFEWRENVMRIISMRRSHEQEERKYRETFAAELQAMRAAGKTQTDWNAAARKVMPDGADPDDAMDPIEWATTELPMPKRKEHTNLRIDADVLAFFRGQGRGYQTKINAVLRSYVAHVMHHKPR